MQSDQNKMSTNNSPPADSTTAATSIANVTALLEQSRLDTNDDKISASTTTPTTSISAAARVLGVAELLEQILLEVGNGDAKTLLLSKSVNKFFLNTIKGSTKIQAALFIQPSSTAPRTLEINPLLASPKTMKGPLPFTHFSVCPASSNVVYITLASSVFSLLGKGHSWESMRLSRANGAVVTFDVLRRKELFEHDFEVGDDLTVKEFLEMVEKQIEEKKAPRV